MIRPSARVAIFFFLAVTAMGCKFPDSFQKDKREFDLKTPAGLRRDVLGVECSNDRRLASAESLFRRHHLDFTTEKLRRSRNIVFDLKGTSREIIVIGAHYDKTDAGCGVIDNWTGVVLLTWLAEEVKGSKTDKSYRFVAFGEEEEGLIGSQDMVDAFSAEERKNVCAMVNLDSFGFEKTWALENISDRALLLLAADVERQRGGSFSIRDYRGAISDSVSFQKIGVPSVTFSGIGKDWREYLHKEKDQSVYIDFAMIVENYLYLTAFLKKLDSIPCERSKPRE